MSNEIYGHLITLNLGLFPSFELTKPINSLGRAKVNTLVIEDARISGQHCQIIFQGNECIILDTSSNGTFINNEKIGKGNKSIIKDGDQLYLLHPTKVAAKELIGFTFKMASPPSQVVKGADQVIQPEDLQKDSINSQIHKKENSSEKKIQQLPNQESLVESVIIKEPIQQLEEKIEKQEKQKPQQNTDLDLLGEEIICTICDDYVFEAVSINPCSHHFCGACLASWMKKKLECPNCRETIKGVQKSNLLNNLVEKYLNAHENKKRSPQAYEKMKEENVFYNQPKKYEQIGGLIQDAREEDDGFVSNQENDSQNEDQENPYDISDDQRSHTSDDENEEYQDQPQNQQNIFQQQQQQQQYQQYYQYKPIGLYAQAYQGGGILQKVNNIFGGFQQQQQLFNRNWPQQQQQFQLQNPQLCKSCNGQTWKGYQCQANQEHVGCSSCGKKLPKRNLTDEENQELQMFCCICKTYNCRYYYGDCQFANQNRFILVKDMKPYFTICSPQINYIEQRRIIQHLAGRPHSTIFDFMMANYIQPRLFYFQQNKASFDHPLIEINTLITQTTPICFNCAPKLCSQIVWKYVSVNKFDEALFMNPECWFGINCRNQKYQNHGQQYSHMCEQTKFEY